MSSRDPEVLDLETQTNSLTARLRFPEDLVYFEGHFSFESMLPAVVQVGWVLELASDHLPVPDSPDQIDRLKFRKKLHPGDECELSIDFEAEDGLLSFAIRQGADRVASGQFSVPDTQ